MNSWHVGVAAEGIAAAQFARYGYDVSVQYGADQPEYDLIASRGDEMLKISRSEEHTSELIFFHDLSIHLL